MVSGCNHDSHHHDRDKPAVREAPGWVGGLLSRVFKTAKSALAPLEKTTPVRAIKKGGETLGNSKLGTIIQSKAANIGLAFGLSATTMLTMPDNPLANLAALLVGFYAMHHTSEYALSDLNTLGEKFAIPAMGLGMISGLAHSASEALVSGISIIQNKADLAMSAVVSHQGFHTLGILGLVAAISGVTRDTDKEYLGVKFNSMNVLAVGTAALAGQLWAGELWASVGAASLVGGLLFMRDRVKSGESCAHGHESGACSHNHDHHHDHSDSHEDDASFDLQSYLDQKMPKLYNTSKALVSLGALIAASYFTVKHGINLAQDAQLSTAQLGVVIAAGAALSEGYLSLRAAFKKQSNFAFGNIMGCNITNTMLIGGGVAALTGVNDPNVQDFFRFISEYNPVSFVNDMGAWISDTARTIHLPESLSLKTSSGMFHVGVFVGAPVLAMAMMKMNEGKISRRQGEVLTAAFIAYLVGSAYIGTPCHDHGGVEHCGADIPALIEQAPDDGQLPDLSF